MRELSVTVGCTNCQRETEVSVKEMLSATSRACPYCRMKIELSGEDERKARRVLRAHQRAMRALNATVPFRLSTL